MIITALSPILMNPVSLRAIELAGSIQKLFSDEMPSFFAPLLESLNLSRGIGTPSFSRETAASVTDFEGIIRQAKSGEARFEGARRVENLCTYSQNPAQWTFGNMGTLTSGVSDPIGGNTAATATATANNQYVRSSTFTSIVGHRYVLSVWLRRRSGTGTVRISNTDASYTDITASLTSSWNRFYVTTSSESDTSGVVIPLYIVKSGDSVDIWGIQIEDITGQANQNPSEYVSTNVLSAPYHGANVDGVQYFDTYNGNTVSSNVVTEATGAKIPDATLKGYLAEGQRTNLLTYSEKFDNAAWAKTNITATADSVASPAGTTTADTLTASSANGTILQTATSASSAHTFSVWIKRKTGTGNIDLTLDGGTTWITKTITSSWERYNITQTLANPSSGIRVATSGDEVYLWGAQLEQGSFASSYIPTTSATVTRNADVDTAPSGNYSDTAGSAYVEATAESWANVAGGIIGDGTNKILAPSYTVGATSYDGTTTASGPTATPSWKVKMAVRWGNGKFRVFVNGSAGTEANYDGAFSLSSMLIGNGFYGNIRNVKIWKKALSDSKLISMTL